MEGNFFSAEELQMIKTEYESLRTLARARCASDAEFRLVEKAFEFANEAHKNVRRRSGTPYILHPIAVAKIVVGDIGLGCKSIVSALLHDVVEDTDYTIDDIRNLFGEKIASLVEGLMKIKGLLDTEESDSLRRVLLTLNDDVRIVLIKLADRLHNCRTIEYLPELKRDRILSQTMTIFIPLAHRLGLYGMKSEMENIWLRYKEPAAWEDICSRIEKMTRDRCLEIDRFISPISDALTAAGFKFTITKRVKSPYSIWKKMVGKGVPFDEVYDLYAVRIIFDPDPASNESERDMCYHIFSIVTGMYRYMPSRVRDWVGMPKSNGYESLHCTVWSQADVWIEVQIRSRRMDDIAEKGIAAHWAYKKDGYLSESDSVVDKWIETLKGILSDPDAGSLQLLDMLQSDIADSKMTVFNRHGNQHSIPKGSTAREYAYIIDKNLGDNAVAAKVNLKLVPLDTVLRPGDQVEIISVNKKNK